MATIPGTNVNTGSPYAARLSNLIAYQSGAKTLPGRSSGISVSPLYYTHDAAGKVVTATTPGATLMPSGQYGIPEEKLEANYGVGGAALVRSRSATGQTPEQRYAELKANLLRQGYNPAIAEKLAQAAKSELTGEDILGKVTLTKEDIIEIPGLSTSEVDVIRANVLQNRASTAPKRIGVGLETDIQMDELRYASINQQWEDWGKEYGSAPLKSQAEVDKAIAAAKVIQRREAVTAAHSEFTGGQVSAYNKYQQNVYREASNKEAFARMDVESRVKAGVADPNIYSADPMKNIPARLGAGYEKLTEKSPYQREMELLRDYPSGDIRKDFQARVVTGSGMLAGEAENFSSSVEAFAASGVPKNFRRFAGFRETEKYGLGTVSGGITLVPGMVGLAATSVVNPVEGGRQLVGGFVSLPAQFVAEPSRTLGQLTGQAIVFGGIGRLGVKGVKLAEAKYYDIATDYAIKDLKSKAGKAPPEPPSGVLDFIPGREKAKLPSYIDKRGVNAVKEAYGREHPMVRLARESDTFRKLAKQFGESGIKFEPYKGALEMRRLEVESAMAGKKMVTAAESVKASQAPVEVKMPTLDFIPAREVTRLPTAIDKAGINAVRDSYGRTHPLVRMSRESELFRKQVNKYGMGELEYTTPKGAYEVRRLQLDEMARNKKLMSASKNVADLAPKSTPTLEFIPAREPARFSFPSGLDIAKEFKAQMRHPVESMAKHEKAMLSAARGDVKLVGKKSLMERRVAEIDTALMNKQLIDASLKAKESVPKFMWESVDQVTKAPRRLVKGEMEIMRSLTLGEEMHPMARMSLEAKGLKAKLKGEGIGYARDGKWNLQQAKKTGGRSKAQKQLNALYSGEHPVAALERSKYQNQFLSSYLKHGAKEGTISIGGETPPYAIKSRGGTTIKKMGLKTFTEGGVVQTAEVRLTTTIARLKKKGGKLVAELEEMAPDEGTGGYPMGASVSQKQMLKLIRSGEWGKNIFERPERRRVIEEYETSYNTYPPGSAFPSGPTLSNVVVNRQGSAFGSRSDMSFGSRQGQGLSNVMVTQPRSLTRVGERTMSASATQSGTRLAVLPRVWSGSKLMSLSASKSMEMSATMSASQSATLSASRSVSLSATATMSKSATASQTAMSSKMGMAARASYESPTRAEASRGVVPIVSTGFVAEAAVTRPSSTQVSRLRVEVPRIKPPKYEPPKPPIAFFRAQRSSSDAEMRRQQRAYVAFAKVAGQWKRVGAPSTRSGAMRMGSEFVKGSPARSFTIRPAGYITAGRGEGYVDMSQFRSAARGTKLRANPVFVEKTEFAINTPGEYQGITLKGMYARRATRKRRKK